MDTFIQRLVAGVFLAALLTASPLRADELGDVTQDLLDTGMSPDAVETLFSGPDDTLGQRAQTMLDNGTITQQQYNRLNSRFLSLPEEKRRLLKNGYSKGYAGKVYNRMADAKPGRLKEAGERKYDTRYEERGKETFDRHDLNKDGVIDAAEAKQSPEANMPGARKRWEMAGGKEGEGMTLEEAKAQREREEAKYRDLRGNDESRREEGERKYKTRYEENGWENFQEADTDKDGNVSLQEANDYGIGPTENGAIGKKRFDMADTNNDGLLSSAEAKAQREREEAKYGDLRREHLDRYAQTHPEFAEKWKNLPEDKKERYLNKARDHKRQTWERMKEMPRKDRRAFIQEGRRHRGELKNMTREKRQNYREAHPEHFRNLRDRRENVRDRKEDRRDRREDIRDRKEDRRDRREDKWDAKHDGGRKDRKEDRRDRREDVRDRKEDRHDRREDVRDRKEDRRDRRDGVRRENRGNRSEAKPQRREGGNGGNGGKGGKGRGRR